MSDSPVPKTWPEAIPGIVWGVLIFAFGFEGVEALIHGEWWDAAAGFGGMAGLIAMLIHWNRVKTSFSDVRRLIAALMFAVIVVVLSPFVEQRRRPFYKYILDEPIPIPQQLKEAQDDIGHLKARVEDLQKQLIEKGDNASANAVLTVDAVPTTLSLYFKKEGAPEQISSNNVSWTYVSNTETEKNPKYNKQDYLGGADSSSKSFFIGGSSNLPAYEPEYPTSYTYIF